MENFTLQAINNTEFEKLGGSKNPFRSWKRFRPLITAVLRSDLFDFQYPCVEINVEARKDTVREVEVINTKTGERMKLLFPRLGENDCLNFENLSYKIKDIESGYWNLSFIRGGFYARKSDSNSDFLGINDLEIECWLEDINAFEKRELICSMLSKLSVYFRYQVEYSPQQVINVICQALCIKPIDIKNLNIYGILNIQNGEIIEAKKCQKNYTVILDFQNKTIYSEENFDLCEFSESQEYYLYSEMTFKEEPQTDTMKAKVTFAKNAIKELLHEVALYNESIKA